MTYNTSEHFLHVRTHSTREDTFYTSAHILHVRTLSARQKTFYTFYRQLVLRERESERETASERQREIPGRVDLIGEGDTSLNVHLTHIRESQPNVKQTSAAP